MKIELYLDKNKVEINEDINFVLNRQYTELTDLTSIIVDYSKTISVPMTTHNNVLFNMIYKLDHQVLLGTQLIDYDPSRKIPMYMTYNGDLVMEGYAVLNKIDLKNKTYEINIFGQLGKIFSELKDKTLENYSFTNGLASQPVMNTSNILKSFNNDYHNIDWDSDDWTDFFGFAPQVYGNTDIMDTKSFEVADDNSILNFEDIINERRQIDFADAYVGDGFDFNQYLELRSYMCRPYVYVDKLIQMVQHEINTDPDGKYGGYHMELDTNWFSTSNPYYMDMCFFPGRESVIDKGRSVTGGVNWNNAQINMYWPMSILPSATSTMDEYTYNVETGNLITIKTLDGNDELDCNITLNCDGIMIRDRVDGVGSTSDFDDSGVWAYYNVGNTYIPVRYIGIYDENDLPLYKLALVSDTVHFVEKHSGFLHWDWSHIQMHDTWKKLKGLGYVVPNSTTWVNNSSSNNFAEVYQYYNFGNILLSTNKFKFKFGCDLILSNNSIRENMSFSEYHTLCPFKSNYKTTVWNDGATWNSWFTPVSSMEVSSLTYRSGSRWSINEILGEDFNPFTWLIDYCKKFRLFFDINYQTKTINLTSNYFDDITYKKVDVDYDKGVTIEPLVDTYNKIDFDYRDSESSKGKKYKKRYGVEYGDVTINTNININTNTMHLNPNEEEGVMIPVNLSCLNFNNLSNDWPYGTETLPIKYSNPLGTNKIINTLNKDGEIEYFPFYAFRLNNYSHPLIIHFYRISDDTPQMKNTGKYCYLDQRTASVLPSGVKNWYTEVEGQDEEGNDVYYMVNPTTIPQFDNWMLGTVNVRSIPVPSNEDEDTSNGPLLISPNSDEVRIVPHNVTVIPDMDGEYEISQSAVNPVTGETKSVIVTKSEGLGEPLPSYQSFFFWTTFGVPKEVYNGNLPSRWDNYSIHSRWKNYLDEIFNTNNKKVTCYVRMSYPEFINFKFNTLFIIDNCTFLVNKIIDFNPNALESTKVELIQISDPNNLR